MTSPSFRTPPAFCQYVNGPCDQAFPNSPARTQVFFLYPSDPAPISATIQTAVNRLAAMSHPTHEFSSWRSLKIAGQVVFCEVCKSVRFSSVVVADVTTLNFNLMFEIGFCIGLGIPIIPIRDTSWLQSKREFEELGVLDVVGYADFTNAEQLQQAVLSRLSAQPIAFSPPKPFSETPIYFLKGQIDTEGAVRLSATLKKSGFGFRTYDPIETPRLSLFEARKQVAGSHGIVANLLNPARRGATVHNALCAFICGMAMAEEKVVAMLQEGDSRQPLDYRDVVQTYSLPDQIGGMLERAFRQIVQKFQQQAAPTTVGRRDLLARLDLGDTAAENEITGLRSYFVHTGQFSQARQGNARLVVGRKGTGKTAIFYETRASIGHRDTKLVLDLKPEGHQFSKLREAVLNRMSQGLQEHTMTAFWNYILLCEMAHSIVLKDISFAHRDPDTLSKYERVKAVYKLKDTSLDGDFSQRLLHQVDRLAEKVGATNVSALGGKITELIYEGDIHPLNDAICEYLKGKDAVWLLVDNIDKGWPTHGTTPQDILIVRALLEATRKLQRQLEEQEVEFKCLVFLRSDIHEHLMRETPDKGKDTAISLEWDDPLFFQEVVHKRIAASIELDGTFREIWPALFESHVKAEDSFSYMLDRTLMRPRDLLLFLHRAVEVAINRGHEKVLEDDILQAEFAYSEDMLLAIDFEISDTSPQFKDVVYAFQGASRALGRSEVSKLLAERGGIGAEAVERVIELLLWYGFLGVKELKGDDEIYSFNVRSNIRHLQFPIEKGDAVLVIHPAFRSALSVC